ncbi:glycosyl transferase family 2 [Coriobacterium glomerans PW2]|uniref:Glycosyl transferase family 2 n=1 Tax=Coriobacterium glomerans (strain ATCC 49209 / DSM 20642 / JCM 10262 / PW2) TaxID=700015 RepID=F2N852_CORGP|nr:glycosyltransferase [Coriobacterium glomerans]AEB07235.1 glycosyl transferase family 2 [Coriobacterium glomerans PW2]
MSQRTATGVDRPFFEQTVSVIVPVYNTERYLDQALESLERQTHQALEILCVNDGSTDGSAAIMRAHAEADSRIRVIDKANGGYGAACNRGIEEARGEWIAILEPDDWIEPGMYADMLAFATTFGGLARPVDIIKTPYWVIERADTPQQEKAPCAYRGRVRPRSQPFAVRDAPHLLGHHPSIWSAIYRRGFLLERGIRFHEIPGSGWADNPFLVETLCQTEGILYLDRAYYCYREETPEKTVELAERSPLLPFERWNDMVDVLERLGVTDRSVWDMQTYRGFLYMSGIIETTGIEGHPEIRDAIRNMFSRMDPELVFANRRVSPACKRLFAAYRGIASPRISELDHIRDLVEQTSYAIWNRGLARSLRMVATYVMRYRARSGRK